MERLLAEQCGHISHSISCCYAEMRFGWEEDEASLQLEIPLIADHSACSHSLNQMPGQQTESQAYADRDVDADDLMGLAHSCTRRCTGGLSSHLLSLNSDLFLGPWDAGHCYLYGESSVSYCAIY